MSFGTSMFFLSIHQFKALYLKIHSLLILNLAYSKLMSYEYVSYFSIPALRFSLHIQIVRNKRAIVIT